MKQQRGMQSRMMREKKRDFFSQPGFGQKEQTPKKETEVQSERPVVEEIIQAQESMKVSEHAVEEQPRVYTEAETETSAVNVVEVTGQVAESEKAQSEAEVVTQPESIVEETPESVAIEREELPLPGDVDAEAVSPEEQRAEAETVETAEAAEEEAAKKEITDGEPEAWALATGMAEEAVMVVSPAEEERPVEGTAQEQEKPTKEDFSAHLKHSLLRARENLGSGSINLFRGEKISGDLLEELEEQLLIADVGMKTTRKITTNPTEGASRKQLRDAEALCGLLKEKMGEILAKVDEPLNVKSKASPAILAAGISGAGETTTIGKLARQFEQQGKSVVLTASDTLRAVAIKQLQVWRQRNNIPVVTQRTGVDSASIIFDAIQAAKACNIDALTANTAGRLQNKSYLMEELKRIARVMEKFDVEAPYGVMLTIDASTGQNGVNQVRLFHEVAGLADTTLTELDGTAKGGVVFSVAGQFGIPVRYIGISERTEDLYPFGTDDFMETLFIRKD